MAPCHGPASCAEGPVQTAITLRVATTVCTSTAQLQAVKACCLPEGVAGIHKLVGAPLEPTLSWADSGLSVSAGAYK